MNNKRYYDRNSGNNNGNISGINIVRGSAKARNVTEFKISKYFA